MQGDTAACLVRARRGPARPPMVPTSVAEAESLEGQRLKADPTDLR